LEDSDGNESANGVSGIIIKNHDAEISHSAGRVESIFGQKYEVNWWDGEYATGVFRIKYCRPEREARVLR